MSCTKKPFDTPTQAKNARARWRSAGRKFDDAHVYQCDACGKYHVGRKHDVMKHGDTAKRDPRAHYDIQIADMLDDLEDTFTSQVLRISGKLSRSAQRIRQANRRALDNGPLIHPETTYAFGGDDVDIRRK